MFEASMPRVGWSPKHGQPGPPAWVVSILNTDHGVVGSPLVLKATSIRDAVKVSLRKRMVANQVLVDGS
jgi:hypothetical protein